MARPRKSTGVLKLTDAWRKDRHGTPEPEPLGALKMPKGLDADAKWFWTQHIEQVSANGAGGGDMAIFTSACSWWSLYRLAEKAIREGDDDYRTFIKLSMAWKNWERAASRLGLSPTERAKLRVPDKPKDTGKSKHFA